MLHGTPCLGAAEAGRGRDPADPQRLDGAILCEEDDDHGVEGILDLDTDLDTDLDIDIDHRRPGDVPVAVIDVHRLSNAETQLQTAGYSTAAHPWGASCSTLGLVMQQVPPQSGTIQLFYCATPS